MWGLNKQVLKANFDSTVKVANKKCDLVKVSHVG
jgi:hypothetical protein